MSLDKAIDKCFDRCNLEGEDCEIWKQMFRYKAIRELSDDDQYIVYNELAERLGF